MPELLSADEIDQRLAGGEWRREGDAIVCERRRADFAQAVRYVDQIAELAESANHHPDILIHGYNRVRLTLSTHSAGGVTEADLALAARIDQLR
jgi:4a-hydroxytetrahydrobiopterin dehydratase